SEREIRWARRAFYALCTQIDQQIGAIIGTIREEGILDETIIMFTSDHGDMLGNHGMWAKQTFYEGSSNVPMILMGKCGDDCLPFGSVDDRVTGLQDIMPTLLGLAGIEPPSHVDGRSMVSDAPRDYIYGEFGEESHSSRMVRDMRHKLIWYPCGNRVQLFDLENDPREMTDLGSDPDHAGTVQRLIGLLRSETYGSDEKWWDGNTPKGEPGRTFRPGPNRGLNLTRGNQWPVPPINRKGDMVFFPEAPTRDVP
ncbi:MAG: sulfatase-like hydrolase/transferase, partial [Boseongicola sp.]|nr:sulfatase-like hydrolase/transferase [Boseongicola sp.]